MKEDIYIVAITVLLPLTAGMVVTQGNPYHAIVMRGILGAVAALVYSLFGAADVALTEALVGTMLSITLYAVAVRSSLSMRLGVVEEEFNATPQASLETIENSEQTNSAKQLLSTLRQTLSKYHMRLELLTYTNPQALETALIAKEVHGTCVLSKPGVTSEPFPLPPEEQPVYHLQVRVQRLYELMQPELPSTLVSLSEFDVHQPDIKVPNLIT
ncbi:MAG: DUF4040 domain-containing protein [Symploca sp. SIO2E6]|nr:DUF4040 domain-containing protein [Symploca sp. SIO2E6]